MKIIVVHTSSKAESGVKIQYLIGAQFSGTPQSNPNARIKIRRRNRITNHASRMDGVVLSKADSTKTKSNAKIF
jgi:hypothetical protein